MRERGLNGSFFPGVDTLSNPGLAIHPHLLAAVSFTDGKRVDRLRFEAGHAGDV